MIRTHGLAWQPPGGALLRFPDVHLEQGGTLLLRGPSGSGKSTWLALVAGLTRPAEGRVEAADTVVSDLQPAARDAWRARCVGVLPQQLLLSPSLTVADNLGLVYFAQGRPVDRVAVDKVLRALGVASLARRMPSGLSGGEAQRVALARALLLRPRLLLADEPTASLDDAACAQSLDLLCGHARVLGATLVIATHDARVAHVLPRAARLELPLGALA